MAAGGLSRRGLFGAGLSRALGVDIAPAPPAPARPAPTPPADPREADPRPAHAAVRRLGIAGGGALVLGGDGPLSEAALAAGCDVTTAETCRPSLAGFDVVLAGFRASRDPAPREIASVMIAAAAPGAALALLAWPGTPWARYETAYRHFCGHPGFDVEELPTPVGDVALVMVRGS